ncbi:MAG TPA: lamin tail domain-containing protein [Candidatus Paceibacterota bacterium]|nr:lamin tail domain-containing protein [Candidatus Paceibacterota bacterium]
MKLKVIKYYLVFLFAFFAGVNIANAGVVINKANSDPIGERFIELYNNSNSPQNLTGWSIKRKSSSGLEYSLVSSSRLEDKIIKANSYFLLTSESGYTGNLSADATWAKSYTFAKGNTILLYNPNDEVVSNFIASTSSNTEVPLDDTEENNNEDNSETTTPSTSNEKSEFEPEVLKITTKIIAPKIVTAGIPFSFNSQTTTNTGKTYTVGRFFWNFGNGDNLRTDKALPFQYMYEYEGEYAVSLSYYDSSFSVEPDAISKMTIKVVPSEIYISSVGDSSNPFIEIENKSNYEVDLSNWIVTAGIHYFTIPDGTMLLPNKKIKLSPKITGFIGEDIKSVVVTNSNNSVVAVYPAGKKVSQRNSYSNRNVKNDIVSKGSGDKGDSVKNNQEIINLNDLVGSAEGSGVNITKSTYAWIGLIVIIGLGITSFLMIQKRKNYDDYIEKEIRAEDMTILE